MVLRTQARRGSVIVLVLVTILLAGFMLVRFIEESSLELTLATREADRNHLRADAYDALELTLAVIAQIRAVDDDKWQSPEQGWGQPYAYAEIEPRDGVEVSITFEDESAKLSLPNADYRRLQGLFETLGLSHYDSERVADAFKAWTDPEYAPVNYESGPEAYMRQTPAHNPPHRPLRSFDEIGSIAVARDFFYDEDGQPTPLFEAFRQCVSLYYFPDTNVSSAKEVLLLANALDSGQIASLRGYRDGTITRPPGSPAYFRTMQEVRQLVGENAPLDGFGVDLHCLRIIIYLREGASHMRLEALVSVDPKVTFPEQAASPTVSRTPRQAQAAPPAADKEKLDYPFKILEIHEDNGLPAELP